eukprot:30626-Pelagococcus_subviridis.AAC.3
MDSFSCLTVRGTRDSARPWERCGERRMETARGRERASARGAKKIDRTTTRARNVASRRGRRRDRARVRARTRRSPMPRTIARETRARAAESRGRLLAPRRERRAIARESTHRAAVRAARGRGLARGEAALSSELGRAAVVTSVHGARVKERASGRVDVRGDASARTFPSIKPPFKQPHRRRLLNNQLAWPLIKRAISLLLRLRLLLHRRVRLFPPLLDPLSQLNRVHEHALVQRRPTERIRTVAQEVSLDRLSVHDDAAARQRHRIRHRRLHDRIHELFRDLRGVFDLVHSSDLVLALAHLLHERAQRGEFARRRLERGRPLEVAQDLYPDLGSHDAPCDALAARFSAAASRLRRIPAIGAKIAARETLSGGARFFVKISSKFAASGPVVACPKTNSKLSRSRRKSSEDESKNALGRSSDMNSKTRSRVTDSSNMTVHFRWCCLPSGGVEQPVEELREELSVRATVEDEEPLEQRARAVGVRGRHDARERGVALRRRVHRRVDRDERPDVVVVADRVSPAPFLPEPDTLAQPQQNVRDRDPEPRVEAREQRRHHHIPRGVVLFKHGDELFVLKQDAHGLQHRVSYVRVHHPRVREVFHEQSDDAVHPGREAVERGRRRRERRVASPQGVERVDERLEVVGGNVRKETAAAATQDPRALRLLRGGVHLVVVVVVVVVVALGLGDVELGDVELDLFAVDVFALDAALPAGGGVVAAAAAAVHRREERRGAVRRGGEHPRLQLRAV